MFDPSPTSQITVHDIGDVSFSSAPSLLHKIDTEICPIGYSFSGLTKDKQLCLLNTLLSKCRLCHLSAEFPPILPHIVTEPKLLVIGRNPNKGDAAARCLFDSPTQVCRLFLKYLGILQVTHQETTILHCCNCYVNRGVAPQLTEILKCREWLYLYLSVIQIPDTILLLGNDAIKAVLGESFPTITSCIGSLLQASICGNKTLIIPIYHPGQVLRQPELWSDVKSVLYETRNLRHVCS